MRILLIDHDPQARAAARAALLHDDAGAEFVEATGVAKAVECCRRMTFDVALLDHRLLGRDGVDTLRTLRAAAGPRVPILVLAERTDAPLAEALLEAGAQDIVIKGELDARRVRRALEQAWHRFQLEVEVRRHHDALRSLVERDPLTGLANRPSFEASLRAAMPRVAGYGDPLALLVLDLDRFKYVNDAFGHEAGNRLLSEVAGRLQGVLRAGELLGRLGGDEFAVLARPGEGEHPWSRVAERFLDAIRRPFPLGEGELGCTASIGMACHPCGARDAEELLKRAELAMYEAKRAGRDRASCYSDELNAQAVRRVTLERELRAALAAEQFELHFQPQFGAAGDIVAAEALLRWRHPESGLLMPLQFLDVAEDSGLIVPIGAWVLEEACRQSARWRHPAGPPAPVVSVNLSGAQLRSEDLVERVDRALGRHGLQPMDLELEITENAIVDSPERASRILDRLSSRGMSIALDDFGTGFSSLSHLRAFPISVLKLERSFLQGAMLERREERLFGSVLTMARSIDVETVVEGVETGEQERLARRHGADRLQGFLFARALPPVDFGRLLRAAA